MLLCKQSEQLIFMHSIECRTKQSKRERRIRTQQKDKINSRMTDNWANIHWNICSSSEVLW